MLDESRIHVLITEEELEQRIKEVGARISADYAGKEILMVCVLKGGVMFMSELAKSITVPAMMEFMVLSSYGNEQISSGQVNILKDMDTSIENKHVLIVEDIVDTGRTLRCLKETLAKRNPASLKICTLLDKPQRRVVELKSDYTCFQIDDAFVLGYGLDYEQYYRNLPYIACVE